MELRFLLNGEPVVLPGPDPADGLTSTRVGKARSREAGLAGLPHHCRVQR